MDHILDHLFFKDWIKHSSMIFDQKSSCLIFLYSTWLLKIHLPDKRYDFYFIGIKHGTLFWSGSKIKEIFLIRIKIHFFLSGWKIRDFFLSGSKIWQILFDPVQKFKILLNGSIKTTTFIFWSGSIRIKKIIFIFWSKIEPGSFLIQKVQISAAF